MGRAASPPLTADNALARPIADESNHSAAGTLHLHRSASPYIFHCAVQFSPKFSPSCWRSPSYRKNSSLGPPDTPPQTDLNRLYRHFTKDRQTCRPSVVCSTLYTVSTAASLRWLHEATRLIMEFELHPMPRHCSAAVDTRLTRIPAVARGGRPYCPINLILTFSPSLIDFQILLITTMSACAPLYLKILTFKVPIKTM